MRKKIFYSFSFTLVFLNFFLLFSYFAFVKASFAATCTSSNVVGAYDNGSGDCENACGINSSVIGINVNGLVYTGQAGTSTCGNTQNAISCIYTDPQNGKCVTGTGSNGGFNPKGGCTYSPTSSTIGVTCPTGLSLAIKVIDSAGNPISGVNINYTEAGWGYTGKTDTNGLITDTAHSFSSDAFTITPNDSRYKFQPTSKTGIINDGFSCGTSLADGTKNTHGPCTFTATATSVTPGITITPSSSNFTPVAGRWTTMPANSPDGIGIVNNANQNIYLRNTPTTGFSDNTFTFGAKGNIILMCDWNGTGIKTPGAFDPTTATWSLGTTNTTSNGGTPFTFGQTGDIPVCGDWTGQGKQTIGVFRPSNGTWYLRNANTAGNPDITFAYGASGDIPIAGKWQKNTTKDTVGVIRGNNWLLRNTNTTGNADITFNYGLATDKFTVGDWTGQGFDTPAAVRDNGKTWLLKNANSSGNPDTTVTFNYDQATFPLTLVVGLPGIGYNGPVGATPKHLTRSVSVELYDGTVTNPSGPGTNALSSVTNTVTFDSGTDNNAGYFVKTINVPLPTTPAANNQYQILVKIPQYLYQLAVNPSAGASSNTHVFTITSTSQVTIPPLILFPGDFFGHNTVSIADGWTQLNTCFKTSTDATCNKTPDGILYTDLDDNGVVDLVDFNIWLRSLSQLQQAQAPGCDTGACQGD